MPILNDPTIRKDPPVGDMQKDTYDADKDGVVDNSEKLEGKTKNEVQDHVKFSIVIPIDTPEATGEDKGVFHFAPGVAGTIEEVYLMAKTAPGTDKTLTVDVNKDGTTIFTTQGNRPSISGTDKTGTSGTPDVTAFAKNDLFTIDVDVSTADIAIADVVVLIRGKQKVA